MFKRSIMVALVMGVVAIMAMPGYASLVPMSWGFPTLVQNNSLTNFQNALQSSTDYELSDISFPTTSSGVLGTAFPTMSQLSNIGNSLSQVAFSNQQQYSQFAYPWLSIGMSPVPSMGLL
jgi:hypothetical protein